LFVRYIPLLAKNRNLLLHSAEQLAVLLLQGGEALTGSVALLKQAGTFFSELFDLAAKRPPILVKLLLGGCQFLPRRVTLLAKDRACCSTRPISARNSSTNLWR
jgi:hypothetical protein